MMASDPSPNEPQTQIPDEASSITPAHVRVLAEAAHLALPPERIATLISTLSGFRTGFAKVRALDTGDREPVTLTHREEATA